MGWAQPAIESNPAYAHLFQGAGGDAAADAGATEQFSITKVWIDPGCIVCNACEDIYPEVFEVKVPTLVLLSLMLHLMMGLRFKKLQMLVQLKLLSLQRRDSFSKYIYKKRLPLGAFFIFYSSDTLNLALRHSLPSLAPGTTCIKLKVFCSQSPCSRQVKSISISYEGVNSSKKYLSSSPSK